MKQKTRKPMKPIILTAIFCPIIAVLLVVGIVGDYFCNLYWYVLQSAFSNSESVIDEELMDEAVAESRALNAEILEEGSVLLKNEGVLPISSPGNINVYGIISANLYLNGNGSSAVGNADSVTLKSALEGEGFTVNSALWNLISAQSVGGSSADINEGSIKNDKVTEISLSKYNSAASWTSAYGYSEYAIVTIGRVGGEGSDLGTNYLTLGNSEVALLKQLDQSGFKVITLINSSHVIEMGPIIQYSDAVLWIGGPGITGTEGVARILSGKVSPSGRLVDTWVYDHTKSSTYYTARTYNYANGGGYTNYNEGIYVGYRWYETADAEGYWGKDGYNGVVAYPFGYGLSYGDLTEEITNVEHADGAFTFTVKATNANDFASKDVFELYVEKPYTNGGVEVSKVELIGFAKSEPIKDGNTYTTTITVAEEDLASYDISAADGKGAYVLAGGEYKFYLASGETGAHCWETLTDEKHCYSCTLEEVVYCGENGRSSDAVTAQNQLGANSNGNALAIDDSNAGYKALSRKDGFANAAQTIGASSQKNKITANATMSHLMDSKYYTEYDEYRGEILSNLKTGQKKQYSFADLYTTDAQGNALYEVGYVSDGTYDTNATVASLTMSKNILGEVDYNDSRWEQLISQMSVDEMEKLICRGGWMTAKIESIDKELGTDYDGPFGLSNLMKNTMGEETKCTSFCSEPVSASTWNVELIERLGEAVGKEANASGQAGWYAPGANIHRTPFGGRNGEYFSEDAFLSGMMCKYESKGALSWGLYCTAKHFAFNDIEANRTGMENCWMSEQTAREIYLKAYEIGVKSGDVVGLMASYMWINGEWLGGNYGLLTGIVRGEWGFNGLINTDNAGIGGGYAWMTASKLVYAGGDLVLANTQKIKLDSEIKNSDAGISAMKTSCKHILYTIANANLHRLQAVRNGANKFVPVYIVANIVVYGAAVACAAVYVTKLILYKKRKSAEGQNEEQSKEQQSGEQQPEE